MHIELVDMDLFTASRVAANGQPSSAKFSYKSQVWYTCRYSNKNKHLISEAFMWFVTLWKWNNVKCLTSCHINWLNYITKTLSKISFKYLKVRIWVLLTSATKNLDKRSILFVQGVVGEDVACHIFFWIFPLICNFRAWNCLKRSAD